MGFDVFLSYRRSDGHRFARKLRQNLSKAHLRVPHAREAISVYLDRIQARADLDFYAQTVRPALLSSRWLIIVATPDTKKRPPGKRDWVAQEIADFESAHGLARIRVVQAAGVTLPDLPHNLLARMPSAQQIDLRGLHNALPPRRAQEDWESLLATLFLIPAEDMPTFRREEERLRRNRLSIGAGAIAGAAVFATVLSGLTLYRSATARNLNNRAAAILSSSIGTDPGRVCDGLNALWQASAPQRPIAVTQCRVTRADAAYLENNNLQRGLMTLGEWEIIAQELPDNNPELDEELLIAEHIHRINKIELSHHHATGQWLTEDTLSEAGLPHVLLAFNEYERALASLGSMHQAWAGLHHVLWPLVDYYEALDQLDKSLALMIRAADALEHSRLISQDDRQFSVYAPELSQLRYDYVIIKRRIGYIHVQQGDLSEARTALETVLLVFDDAALNSANWHYQHALAQGVMGDVVDAEKENPIAWYISSLHSSELAAQAAPDDWDAQSEHEQFVLETLWKLTPQLEARDQQAQSNAMMRRAAALLLDTRLEYTQWRTTDNARLTELGLIHRRLAYFQLQSKSLDAALADAQISIDILTNVHPATRSQSYQIALAHKVLADTLDQTGGDAITHYRLAYEHAQHASDGTPESWNQLPELENLLAALAPYQQ